MRFPPEVEAAWIQGCAEIDPGEFVTLTPEQLKRWAETGEWPWPDESQDGALRSAEHCTRRGRTITASYRAVITTLESLAAADQLPGFGDLETPYAPGTALARRVPGNNLWLLYRFDDTHIDVVAVRHEPPVPIDPPDE